MAKASTNPARAISRSVVRSACQRSRLSRRTRLAGLCLGLAVLTTSVLRAEDPAGPALGDGGAPANADVPQYLPPPPSVAPLPSGSTASGAGSTESANPVSPTPIRVPPPAGVKQAAPTVSEAPSPRVKSTAPPPSKSVQLPPIKESKKEDDRPLPPTALPFVPQPPRVPRKERPSQPAEPGRARSATTEAAPPPALLEPPPQVQSVPSLPPEIFLEPLRPKDVQARRERTAPPEVSLLPEPPLSRAPAIVRVPAAPRESTPSPDQVSIDIVLGHPRVLVLADTPQRMTIALDENDPVVLVQGVPNKGREWYLIGRKPGSARLDVTLPGADGLGSHRRSYLIRVVPEPRPEETLEVFYRRLSREINQAFPGCEVSLSQAGEKLVVSGRVRNLYDAMRILSIARSNAPGSGREGVRQPSGEPQPAVPHTAEDFAQAGGPHVINLLQVPGQQQVMMRVVVVEVNSAAARSVGLDFALAQKQGNIITSRPGEGSGSSRIANGSLLGEIKTLRTLQYARTLAEPTLTALDGQVARFQAGGELPVPVMKGTPSALVQGVEYRPFGVQLSVLPIIIDRDRFRLQVSVNVNGPDASAQTTVNGQPVPGMNVRNFDSTVELREGETLVIGGLMQRTDLSGLDNATPKIGDLFNPRPGSGAHLPREKELLVLISPALVRPSERDTASRPGTAPLGPQGNERPAQNDNMFLLGPHGYSDPR
jgi:pilus assembly protein CpaC